MKIKKKTKMNNDEILFDDIKYSDIIDITIDDICYETYPCQHPVHIVLKSGNKKS